MKKQHYKIKWRNTYSQETGYVKDFKKINGYFENTYNKDEAKDYTEKTGSVAINGLNEVGEGAYNVFELEMV